MVSYERQEDRRREEGGNIIILRFMGGEQTTTNRERLKPIIPVYSHKLNKDESAQSMTAACPLIQHCLNSFSRELWRSTPPTDCETLRTERCVSLLFKTDLYQYLQIYSRWRL